VTERTKENRLVTKEGDHTPIGRNTFPIESEEEPIAAVRKGEGKKERAESENQARILKLSNAVRGGQKKR